MPYRTSIDDDCDWVESVKILMAMCKIIILDTRDVSEPVMVEAKIILEKSYVFKTIFLVDSQHNHPVLDQILIENAGLINKETNYLVKKRRYTEEQLLKILEYKNQMRKIHDLFSFKE
jgi:hypothetical protein